MHFKVCALDLIVVAAGELCSRVFSSVVSQESGLGKPIHACLKG